ncbi:twisted gastrulation protein homolog 1-like [Oppia nitens]|uniref:twisted gastrulation protein homolog 1-like n=1 Tax=Oppia nitens TaxID=1686743 RepID=UPI0023DA66D8|nr:twisted gastrulation protein homolog 1-like [Oppia nitens]
MKTILRDLLSNMTLMIVLLVFVVMPCVWSCNEAVCGSIVSKCMLTQSCRCGDFKQNRSCSQDCFRCLDYLYHDCCSCVELCPKANISDTSLASKSHVEDLPEAQPDLFAVLTEEKDHLLRWTSYSMPLKVVIMEPMTPQKSNTNTDGSDGIDVEKDVAVNCTVAYMSQCMSWNKCKSSCTSMGSASYRWFHDGCCQCVGTYCINYGINESKCLQCPLTPDNSVNQEIDERDPNTPTDERISDYDIDDNTGHNRNNEEETHNTLNEKSDKNDKQNNKKTEENLNENGSKGL